MQSSDHFKESLIKAFNNSFTEEDDQNTPVNIQRRYTKQDSLSPSHSNKNVESKNSSTNANENTGEVSNRKVSFISSKRNPISEGPSNIQYKRGNPMERNDISVKKSRRPRILSSDMTLIDNEKLEKASKYKKSA